MFKIELPMLFDQKNRESFQARYQAPLVDSREPPGLHDEILPNLLEE